MPKCLLLSTSDDFCHRHNKHDAQKRYKTAHFTLFQDNNFDTLWAKLQKKKCKGPAQKNRVHM